MDRFHPPFGEVEQDSRSTIGAPGFAVPMIHETGFFFFRK